LRKSVAVVNEELAPILVQQKHPVGDITQGRVGRFGPWHPDCTF
jgi:hypothetical protein